MGNFFPHSSFFEGPSVIISDERLPQWQLFIVKYDDSSPVTLVTVPAGKLIFVEAAQIAGRVAFDGTAPTIGVGPANDPDGYIIAADTTAALKHGPGGGRGASGPERGERLWDPIEGADVVDVQFSGTDIVATLDPDGSTQGEVIVLLKYAFIDNPLG